MMKSTKMTTKLKKVLLGQPQFCQRFPVIFCKRKLEIRLMKMIFYSLLSRPTNTQLFFFHSRTLAERARSRKMKENFQTALLHLIFFHTANSFFVDVTFPFSAFKIQLSFVMIKQLKLGNPIYQTMQSMTLKLPILGFRCGAVFFLIDYLLLLLFSNFFTNENQTLKFICFLITWWKVTLTPCSFSTACLKWDHLNFAATTRPFLQEDKPHT